MLLRTPQPQQVQQQPQFQQQIQQQQQPQQQEQQGRLTGYLLTPVAAPADYVNNPADIPPMNEGQFTRMGGNEQHPLYVIQNPDTTGQASVLPPGFSANPSEPNQKPNGFFMPIDNAPLRDGRPFTLMVVNGMRSHGPAYNALPVAPEVSVKSEVVGYQAPAAPSGAAPYH
ncbi:unnamed protein product, partial [Mesorhabditis spiculigera]